MSSGKEKIAFKEAYAVVGELILLATALDHQCNHVLIQVLNLGGAPLLEPVVATLDPVRKIEILKERAKHIGHVAWKTPLIKYLEKVEKINAQRNIACHRPLIPDGDDAVFGSVAAAKLLKNLYKDRPSAADLKKTIALGEVALGEGINLIENFERFNKEYELRNSTSHKPTTPESLR
ncbi:MAG: hypothetical protein P4L72_16980 [Parvibaculum sp.]|uniref:hypothetical protein n=1 Tax=Parvibaculum sp. TaxID=2024848 RepID=UPI00284E7AE0|nr:hypothetical protein [Parvibaculum sp.]MDR3500910.1 hypothetical protein [Parvibaculum sp.]